MRRMRSTASLIAAIALSIGVATGCGKVVESLSHITEVTQPSSRAPIVTVDPPDASHASDAVVADAARSVVKIRSMAHACQKILQASGLVSGHNPLMSAPHAAPARDNS